MVGRDGKGRDRQNDIVLSASGYTLCLSLVPQNELLASRINFNSFVSSRLISSSHHAILSACAKHRARVYTESVYLIRRVCCSEKLVLDTGSI